VIASRFRIRPAAPLCGVAGSAILHVAAFAVAAAIPAGLLVAHGPPDETGAPLAVTIALAREESPPVIVSATHTDSARVPPSPPETIDVPEWPVAPPACACDTAPAGPSTPSRFTDGPPSLAKWNRLAQIPSLRPGHGSAGRGASGSPGHGTIGVGGAGGTGTGEGGNGGGSGGTGTGEGGDGSGTGWAARGGETRGPAIVSPLTAPPYPPRARSHGWEGRVVLDLTIDERGRVVAVAVAESSGRDALDEAARDAATSWTLGPALRDGEPVAGTLRVPVRFELTD